MSEFVEYTQTLSLLLPTQSFNSFLSCRLASVSFKLYRSLSNVVHAGRGCMIRWSESPIAQAARCAAKDASRSVIPLLRLVSIQLRETSATRPSPNVHNAGNTAARVQAIAAPFASRMKDQPSNAGTSRGPSLADVPRQPQMQRRQQQQQSCATTPSQ